MTCLNMLSDGRQLSYWTEVKELTLGNIIHNPVSQMEWYHKEPYLAKMILDLHKLFSNTCSFI